MAAITVQAQQKHKRVLELQADLEDVQRSKSSLLEKLDTAEVEIAHKRKTLHARQLELDDSTTELSHLRERVATFTAQAEADRVQQEKVASQLNELLREKQAMIESQKTQFEQDLRSLESKLSAALTTVETNSKEHAREISDLQTELRTSGDSAAREVSTKEQENYDLKQQLREALEQVAALQGQMDEQTTALLAASRELEQSREQLDKMEEVEREIRAANEQKEKELRESLLKEAEKEAGDVKKMREQIRAMAHRRTPAAEDKSVDLVKYLAVALMTPVTPEGFVVTRLCVKADLLKPFSGMSQTNWKSMWTVLDLQSKSLTFYTDKRQFKSHAKGGFSLAEITKVTMPDTDEAKETFSFLVTTGKRTTHLRALSRAHMDVWIHIFAAVTSS